MQETGLLAKGAYMHVVFARNAAFRINDSIHAATALLPALQLLSDRCGKLPSKLGNRIGGHKTSNHSSAYASNIVLDLEFTPADHAGRAQRLTDEIIEVGAVKVEEAANWCGIPFEANRAHRALYDAQMTAELFRMMLAGDLAAQRETMSSQVKSPSDEKPPLVYARRFLWRAGRASRQPEIPGACLRMTEDASPASPRGRRIRYDVMRR